MPLYFSSHVTACLTKQALRDLVSQVFRAQEVQVLRAVSSQHGGRMLLEIEAPDQRTVEAWIDANRLNSEWVMRIDLEGDREGIRER